MRGQLQTCSLNTPVQVVINIGDIKLCLCSYSIQPFDCLNSCIVSFILQGFVFEYKKIDVIRQRHDISDVEGFGMDSESYHK